MVENILHDVIVASAPTLTALAGVIATIRNGRKTDTAVKKIDDNTSKTERVVHQVEPNTGSSLNDGVARAVELAEEAVGTVLGLTSKLKEVGSRVDGMASRIDMMANRVDGIAEKQIRIEDKIDSSNP